jgi:hypothetical protein
MNRRQVELSPEVIHKIWSNWKQGDFDEDGILRRILTLTHIDDAQTDNSQIIPNSNSVDGKEENISEAGKAPSRSMTGTLDEAVEMGKIRWVDDVRVAFGNLGGEADLPTIYKEVEQIRRAGKRSIVKSLDATIRQTIEAHSRDSKNYREGNGDYFEWVGRGRWKLR